MTEQELLKKLREIRAEHEAAVRAEKAKGQRFHALRQEMVDLLGGADVQVEVQHSLGKQPPKFDVAWDKAERAIHMAVLDYVASWRNA